MRNRGNNEVAPITEELISLTVEKNWKEYEKAYRKLLRKRAAKDWMIKRAWEARVGNILLVCYEKDVTHCHRRLLAEEIARHFPAVEYKGELY